MAGRGLTRLWPIVAAALAVAMALSFGACTQDDAFISFRYAENLLLGHGLVFNPGERVEGYSNPLWTLLMAGVMGVGLDPVLGSILLGVLSLGALLLLTARLLPAEWAGPAALLLLAGDASLAAEAVEGLETTFHTALIVGGAVLLKGEVERARPHLLSGLVLGLVAISRPEGALVFIALHGGLFLHAASSGERGSAKARLRASALGAIPFALLIGLHLAWRLGYYGEWLPNTFHAKVGGGGHAILRGLTYVGRHAITHPLLWLSALGGLLVAPRRAAWSAFACLTALHVAYVVVVGGDFKPTGRFLIPILPFLATSAGLLYERVLTDARPRLRVAATLLWLAGLLPYLPLHRAASAQAAERHANLEARRTVGEWLAAALPRDAVLAIHSAGVIPYYAGLPTLDMWGLTDAHIARVEVPSQGRGLAGHEKGDPAYVFARNPAVYLPEDRVFTLRPWQLEPEPGFPEDFQARYRAISVPIEGRWLNAWFRLDLLDQ
jgi:hypothetical protein